MAKTQRLVIQTFGFIVLLIGIFIGVEGILLIYNDHQKYKNSIRMLGYEIFGQIILYGFIIMIIGANSLIAFQEQDSFNADTALCFNQITTFVFFLYFGQISLFLFIEADQIVKISCDQLQESEQLETYFLQLNELFCSEDCPCYVELSNIEKYPEKFKGKVYTTDEEDQNKMIRVQHCEQIYDLDLHVFQFKMEFLERNLNCSGWCSQSPYFIFSDINNDSILEKSCFEELQSILESYLPIITFIFVELTFLSGFVVIFSISFFFHRKRNIKDQLKNSDSDSEVFVDFSIFD